MVKRVKRDYDYGMAFNFNLLNKLRIYTMTKATATTKIAIAAPTMTVKAMDAAIAGVIDDSMKLQDRIHEVAVAIMLHTYKHADFSRAQVLVDGLGKGVRRSALVEWFKAAGLKVSEQEQKFNGFNKAKMEDKWGKCLAEPWHTMKPENPFAGFDLDAELARLIAKAEKAMAKNSALPEDAERPEGFKFACDAEKMATLRKLAGVTLQ